MTSALRLLLLGFLTLFLELALIRYLSGNIWNLGYFPNLVLLAAFLGMGAGFAFHTRVPERRSLAVFHGSAGVLLALTALVALFHPTVPGFDQWQGEFGSELYFTAAPAAEDSSLFLFVVWFLAIVAVFAAITQRTAKVFRLFEPLRAYTLDIAGSCLGILAFMAASAFGLPPWTWFGLAAALYFALGRDGTDADGALRWVAPVAAAGCALISIWQDSSLLAVPGFQGPVETRWSPYQKIEYVNAPPRIVNRIFVNGVDHQHLGDAASLADPKSKVPYSRPYLARKEAKAGSYKKVLVIGAGSGNDVAAALLNGAEHVDAVEIDPVIARVGRERHPARPFSDPRVSLIVDDGRAFLARADGGYDLIVFALTDSLVKVSAMAQLRLENYLFTVESVRRAFELLSPTGDIVFYNFYRTPWLLEKIGWITAEATGRFPDIIHQDRDFLMLRVGRASGRPAQGTAPLPLPRDDWPFLYLRDREIPAPYLWGIAAVVAAVAALGTALSRDVAAASAVPTAVKLAFAGMGAAFLLLETKSVIQFSLLFGTTWLNSSLVFLGILLLVLAANHLARFVPRRALWLCFALLVGACLVQAAIPLGQLLEIRSGVGRFVAGSLLSFLPIFFANLIFSVSFREQSVPESAFGWNLLGAAIGGTLEYASMVTGYSALALVAAALYAGVGWLLLYRPKVTLAPSP